MSSGRSKGPDEVFCESCGEPIKKEAERCPHCGVRPGAVDAGGITGGESASAHDPSQYETSVSDSWWIGVLVGVGGWIVLFALASVSANLGAAGGFAVFAVWIGLPLSAYFDMKYVRANSEWDPTDALWVILLLVWLANVIAGGIYLYRRHEVLGTP